MKIVNAFGEFSGKLAGMVFARNRGGAYVRRYVTPLNPSTAKQRAVRERFALRANEWQQLSEDARAAWNEYAGTKFLPLVGTGNGTGQNAFVSNRQAVANANVAAAATSYNVELVSRTDFPLPEQPPNAALVADVKVGSLVYVPSVLNATYDGSHLTVFVSNDTNENPEPYEFKNSDGDRVALNLYVSSPSGGSYFSNPYRNLFASTAGVVIESLPATGLGMRAPITLQINAKYRVTLVIMDEFGQQLPISTYDFVAYLDNGPISG